MNPDDAKHLRGGPAFPMAKVTVLAEDGTPNEAAAITHDGMSLRDYFAAKAMQALIGSRHISYENGDYDEDVVAEHAYLMADEMLAAREAQ